MYRYIEKYGLYTGLVYIDMKVEILHINLPGFKNTKISTHRLLWSWLCLLEGIPIVFKINYVKAY